MCVPATIKTVCVLGSQASPWKRGRHGNPSTMATKRPSDKDIIGWGKCMLAAHININSNNDYRNSAL